MRDRRVRLAFVGLIFAFPIMMVVTAGNVRGAGSIRQAALPVLAVEAVLFGGLTTAARERQRLLGEQVVASGHGVPASHVALAARPVRRAAASRS